MMKNLFRNRFSTKLDSFINVEALQDYKAQNNLSKFLILMPIMLATYLSFYRLGAKSFWLDEAFSIFFVSHSWTNLWDIISQREANASLYYVLLKIWVEAFGDSEFAARSLSVVFAVGAVIMTYGVGVRLFNIQTGLSASLILAVNSFFVQWAQEARGYALLLLLATSSMYLFIRVIENQQYRYYIALGLTNVLIFYTHFFGCFIVIAQVVSLIFFPPGRIQWWKMIVCAILMATLTIPSFVLILIQGTDSVAASSSTASLCNVISLFKNFTGNGGKFLLMLYIILCFLYLTILVRIMISYKKSEILWRHALPICWLFVPISCICILSLFKPVFTNRYMFYCLPALVILTGAGLSSLRYKVFYIVAISLMIILSLHTIFDVYYPQKKEDWRTATHLIVQNAKIGDAILFYGTPAKLPFDYYYGKMSGGKDVLVSVYPAPLRVPLRHNMWIRESNPSDSMLDSLSERYNRLWLVLSHDILKGRGRDSRPIIAKIEEKFTNRENIFFDGINIKLYERKLAKKKL